MASDADDNVDDGPAEAFIYIIPQKIQKKRLKDVKRAAKRKGLSVLDSFSSQVTHVVTEVDKREKVLNILKVKGDSELEGVEILRFKWFSSCLKKAQILPVLEEHRVQKSPEAEATSSLPEVPQFVLQEWACQRPTPLIHFNEKLTNALEVLQLKAELTDVGQDYSRALAFRRASCLLKSIPFQITNVHQLDGCKDIGRHSRMIIQEVLDEGFSSEVEEILNDQWFKKMKLFTSVFGVGSATAKIWVERGWSTIAEAQAHCEKNDWRLQWGLPFHDDLMDQVSRNEAENLTSVVREEAERLLPGIIVQLTGGFRRGKSTGHDIDILFSHPEEGKEQYFLPQLLERLEKRSLILYGKWEKSTFSRKVLSKDFKLSTKGQLDHFEKWIGIMKLPKEYNEERIVPSGDFTTENLAARQPGYYDGNYAMGSLGDYEPMHKKQKVSQEELSPVDLASSPRTWKARRVDLIVSPYNQYYYALVGWTGSKQFNRDIRTYAQRVLNRKLTSHGLWDYATNREVEARSEQEVFDALKVPHFKPSERNC